MFFRYVLSNDFSQHNDHNCGMFGNLPFNKSECKLPCQNHLFPHFDLILCGANNQEGCKDQLGPESTVDELLKIETKQLSGVVYSG